MEYIALYRRYRPRNFSEIMGQSSNVTILKNQIATDKITHAYLFCGTRGTGKTSAAKIFAKAVNCENHPTGEPCHICNTCKTIESNNVMDILEIDAASNRGVDEIRELREKVKYPPTVGRYKVYIIDEVHMLTSEAFNALLKTLEEPPEHVIFILATTEPNKLPTTILSRCQRYNFKRIEIPDIVSNLRKISGELNIKIEDSTLKLIAQNSDGAMRDALSILDQCFSISVDNEVNYEKVLELLGISDNHIVYEIVEAIVDKNPQIALKLLDEAYSGGTGIIQLINQIILSFRDMLIIKITDSNDKLVESSTGVRSRLKELGDRVEVELISYYIEYLADMENKMKYSTLPKILMEVALIKISSVVTGKPSNVVIDKPQIRKPEVKKREKEVAKEELTLKEEALPPKDNAMVGQSTFNFHELLAEVKKESRMLGSSLELGKLKSIDEKKVVIEFHENDAFHKDNVSKNKKSLEKIVKKLFGEGYFIELLEEKKEEEPLVKLAQESFGKDKVIVIDE